MPFSTRKPLMLALLASSPVLPHTTATSARVPFVIQRFVPLRDQPPSTFFARVRIDAGSLPASGSVRPKQPTFLPLARAGSHFSFCASLPNAWMGYMHNDPWTLTKERTPESARSSSLKASQYDIGFIPAQP